MRELEQARLEILDPPLADDNGRQLVARVPVLSAEFKPHFNHAVDELETTLGSSRAKLLSQHLEDFANEHFDGFGSVTREFLYRRDNLNVRYVEDSGTSFRSRTEGSWNQFGPYSHLFGNTGPLPLREIPKPPQ